MRTNVPSQDWQCLAPPSRWGLSSLRLPVDGPIGRVLRPRHTAVSCAARATDALLNTGAAPTPRQNQYWLLRHGRSKANEAGIIVSRLEDGIKQEWELAEAGKKQAIHAGKQLLSELGPDFSADDLRVYHSPFSRTKGTAELAAQAFGFGAGDERLQAAPELAERSFGSLDFSSDSKYGGVWLEDTKTSSFRPAGGGESVQDVVDRLGQLLKRLEEAHQGCTILLVSHGDTLSIFWAYATGTSLLDNRRHGLNTGELRKLSRSLG